MKATVADLELLAQLSDPGDDGMWAIASAEVTHWLDEDWGIAAFVDAGDAVDSLHDVRLALGYGLGARWRSPAGPIGVDLAYGERTRGFQLHFSLAIPF